jgi:hypothetical protein
LVVILSAAKDLQGGVTVEMAATRSVVRLQIRRRTQDDEHEQPGRESMPASTSRAKALREKKSLPILRGDGTGTVFACRTRVKHGTIGTVGPMVRSSRRATFTRAHGALSGSG